MKSEIRQFKDRKSNVNEIISDFQLFSCKWFSYFYTTKLIILLI